MVVLPELLGRAAHPPPSVITAAGRSLTVGVPVRAQDGTIVGHVSGFSRSESGQVERIRFRTAAPLALGERIVTLGGGSFTLEPGAVQLRLSVEQIVALPGVMIEDGAAAFMGRF